MTVWPSLLLANHLPNPREGSPAIFGLGCPGEGEQIPCRMVPILPVVPLQVVVPHLAGKSVSAVLERREDVVGISADEVRALPRKVGADNLVQEHPDPRLDRLSTDALIATMPDVGVVQVCGEA